MTEEILTLRTDQVGSLLRPPRLVDAMALAEGAVTPEELADLQNAAIRDVILKQQAIGMQVVTDGEFRRHNFQESFGGVAGADGLATRRAGVADGEGLTAPGSRSPEATLLRSTAAKVRITQRLALRANRALEEYSFASSIATAPVKVAILSVDRIHERIDFEASESTYEDPDELMADVVAVSRQIVGGLVEAGSRYIQVDGPNYTRFVDADSLSDMKNASVDPMEALERAMAWDNAVIEGFPGVVFGMHICRGNNRSMWHRTGSYDAIAARLFDGLRHQRLLLEYDSPRAGNFEPLRFLPADKVAVLGLITSKVGKLEDPEDICRRVAEASRYAPLDQLALSPQCGFGSDMRGNQLTPDDQWRKLELVLATADQIWG